MMWMRESGSGGFLAEFGKWLCAGGDTHVSGSHPLALPEKHWRELDDRCIDFTCLATGLCKLGSDRVRQRHNGTFEE